MKKNSQIAITVVNRKTANASQKRSDVHSFLTKAAGAFIELKLRTQYLLKDMFPFNRYPHFSESRGMDWNNKADFLFMPEIFSIKKHLYWETISFGLVLILFFLGLFAFFNLVFGISVFVFISALIALTYVSQMLFKVIVVYKSLNRPILSFMKKEVLEITDEELPIYTILIPLYREEKVIDQIKKAMMAIDYPTEKLDIIITLEEYDHWTIDAIREANLPKYFKTLILPDVQPKTKPKALNVAFSHTKGEFLVIYDAEIVPDPDQLKKAYLAFRKHPEIASLQTRLDHYNTNQNFITKLFNAEFSFYYDLFLPGLHELGTPIPLSGHSTHFRRKALSDIGAWDPYNVTEDCDVGIRLHRKGYKTDILDSFSKEEATSNISSWMGQRTRWMKGFIQTSIVHLRYPFLFKDEIGGWKSLIAFFFTVPGTVLINILNLFSWIMLFGWFLTHSAIIQAFFPSIILYISNFSFIFGNFIFTYLNLVGSYTRRHYSLVKVALFSPIYWIMLAVATVRSVVEIVKNPYHWEKTKHGENLV